MSAEELIRVEEIIVLERGYKILEADWRVLAYPGNGNGPRTHVAVCGDVKVSLTKQTTVVREARGRYSTAMMGRELTFILPRDTRDEELAAVESILSGLVRFIARDTASVVEGNTPCTPVGGVETDKASPASPGIFNRLSKVHTSLSSSLSESFDSIGKKIDEARRDSNSSNKTAPYSPAVMGGCE